MEALYDVHGLVFWSEREIRIRNMLLEHFRAEMLSALQSTNRAWVMYQTEAPLLTPRAVINPNYTAADVWFQDGGEMVLRPETTPGSYVVANKMLAENEKPPFCVWQIGKSFRREPHSQSYGHMRLDEFYQLEFQCIYTAESKNDYHAAICPAVEKMISSVIKLDTRMVASDRLPTYSEITMDVEVKTPFKWMEVCSISRRTDFPGTFKGKELRVVEVAIGMDRMVHAFNSERIEGEPTGEQN